MLLPRNRLDQRAIRPQFAPVSQIALASWKRCMILITGDPLAALLVELLGMVHRFGCTDESDMHLSFMPGSPKRPRAVQRNTRLRVAMLLVAGKKEVLLAQEVNRCPGDRQFHR